MKVNPLYPGHSVHYGPPNPKYRRGRIVILHTDDILNKNWVVQWKNTNEEIVPFVLRKTHQPYLSKDKKKHAI